jgi:type IV secretory pathway TraG/TraD family ATPase VirD4
MKSALKPIHRMLLGGGVVLVGLSYLLWNLSFLGEFWKTEGGIFLLVAAGLGVILFVKSFGTQGVKTTFRRGAIEKTYKEAVRRAKELSAKFGVGPFFGMLELPISSKEGHFCVVGATGSGKTVTIRFFLQRIIPDLEEGPLQGRALIYDAKQDMIPLLSNMGGGDTQVHILNPFDLRSSPWDMAKDITEPATAYQVASLIISDPDKADGNSMFFVNTMRNIMSAVIQSFIEFTPDDWTFRDILLAMATEANLRLVLERTPKGRQVLEACIKQGETFDNIRASIEARISEYEIIAALWHSSSGPNFSLREWLKSRSILVLGNRESSRKVMDTLNALLFNRLVELINDGPENSDETTWIVLDEVRRAGKLDKLKDLLLFGRSKGASVLLGLQDVDGLREVYGQNVANEILGQCANKAILWLNSPETAKWASSLFGEEEVVDFHRNKSSSSNGIFGAGTSSLGTSFSESITKRELVLTSELLSKSGLFGVGGIGGYYSLQNVGDYKLRVSSDWVRKELLPKDETEQSLCERPVSDQRLLPWDRFDLLRLRLGEYVPPSREGEEGMRPELPVRI